MSSKDQIVLPPGVQRDVDALAKALRAKRRNPPAFERVTSWLEPHAEDGTIIDFDECFSALPPWTIVDRFADVDDDRVAEELELPDDEAVTARHRLKYFEDKVIPGLFEDADVCSAFGPVHLTASDGSTLVLFQDTRGYSFSGITVEWSGPYESIAAFEKALIDEGWITGIDAFRSLSETEKLRRLGRASPNR